MRYLIFINLMILSLGAYGVEYPDGWRAPTEKELGGPFRSNSENKYINAKADFNGDNKTDEVYLLVSTKFKGDGLLAYLSGKQGYKWVPIHISNWDKLYPNNNYKYYGPAMGVTTRSKESAIRLVENPAYNFEQASPTRKELNNAVVDYFKFGSAASFFYWKESEGKFVRYWYSD